MSFISVFAHNTVASVVSLLCVVFVGMAVLKILPADSRKCGLCRIALAMVCQGLGIFIATVFYKQGLLVHIFNSILLLYLQLIVNAFCVGLILSLIHI